jgi:indole-3-acetate monooxygenase
MAAVDSIATIARQHADASERERCLAKPVMDAIMDLKLHKLLAPALVGGGQSDPLTFHRAIRQLSALDGSTGWCTWVGNISAWYSSRLAPGPAQQVLGDPRAYPAGTLFPFGEAHVDDGGFRVRGRWPYASGCQHATGFQSVCVVYEGGQPRMAAPEMPEVRIVTMRRDQVEIIDTWDVNGLAGTGSHDVAATDAFVPEELTAPLAAPADPEFAAPLYSFPLVGIISASIAASGFGIGDTSVEAALELARTKVSAGTTVGLRERPVFQVQMAEAMATLRSAEAWLEAELQGAWETATRGEPVGMDARGNLALAASHGTQSAARAVELAYFAAGGTANYRSSPLQRALRDVHAVTQHAAASPHQFETAGRVLGGLEPGNPLLEL